MGFSRRTAKGNASNQKVHSTPGMPPSVNKTVSGFGRLRRPSSQPATSLAESGSQISVGKVAEPGNRMVEAGSETAER